MDLRRLIAKGLRILLQPPAKTSSTFEKPSVVCSGTQINNSIMHRYAYAGHDCFILFTEIGPFCSIADGCRIGGAMHTINNISTSPVFLAEKNVLKTNFTKKKLFEQKWINIGADVWIGANAIILSGISIGAGAIVGAGSVVTHDIGPYEIWAGNPAKMIRKRFSDEIIINLLKIQWWNWSYEKISRYADLFDKPEDFVKACRENGEI